MEVKGAVSVLERLQGDKFCQLAAQHFRVTTEVVSKDLRCLLILCKVTTLVKAARARRVHEEVGRSAQLNDEASLSRWRSARVDASITRL